MASQVLAVEWEWGEGWGGGVVSQACLRISLRGIPLFVLCQDSGMANQITSVTLRTKLQLTVMTASLCVGTNFGIV